MTDYEEKFFQQGKPINRCVAAMGALPAEMEEWIDPLDKPRTARPAASEEE